MSPNPRQVRIAGSAGVFFMLLLIALGRAFQLCVLEGAAFKQLAVRQQQERVSSPPERGAIVDRHGDVLAMTVEASAIYLRPQRFHPSDVPMLAHTLGLAPSAISDKATATAKFVWLLRGATPDQAQALGALSLPGVGSEPGRRRIYPHGALAGQVIGAAGVDLQGLWGVEGEYDDALRGTSEPQRVECDAHGRRLLRDGTAQPGTRAGARVELTIDAALEEVTETALQSAVTTNRAAGGTAVVMDPDTGEIYALAQVPAVDPGNVGAAVSALARNRVISDTYEPGSTMKGVLAAAAIEAGVVRPDERLYCENGSYTVGRRVVHDHERFGWLTFADVIRHSSNICAAKVGERLGAERLAKALSAFGLDAPTHIDLPGEASGLMRPWQKWARINLVTTSFGQGIAVTPIQLVRAYAAIANGGALVRPFVVRRVVAADGSIVKENRPEVTGHPISAATAATVTAMLRGVVESGTGTKAQVDGIAVAGKTGTAQKVDAKTGRYSARDRMSSFVGYLPADAPRFVILVVIDSPRTATYGGLVAAPAFRRIAEYGVDRLGLRVAAAPRPQQRTGFDTVRLVGWQSANVKRGMPSFLGLSMREALKQAQRAGWDVQVQGSGFVVAQDPPPGIENVAGRTLRLSFGSAAG